MNNQNSQEDDRLKSEFISLTVHQIRAPLSTIKGYVSEIFEGDFGPYSKELEKPLQIISQSTENLVHIVGDFLNISHIESGKMKYELADFDLKPLVAEVVDGFKHNLERAGLEMTIDAPESEYKVHADAEKMKQIVWNLLDNSIKYTPKGNIKVSLKKEGQKVLLSINDTGIGIPLEVLPKLFQKFCRAENIKEVSVVGTGLSLHVAKLMMEGQNGRVWAESPGVGQGSTFYVELPVNG